MLGCVSLTQTHVVRIRSHSNLSQLQPAHLVQRRAAGRGVAIMRRRRLHWLWRLHRFAALLIWRHD